MSEQLEKGDKVSWNWGSGQPSGKVADIVEGRAEVKSNRGNTIAKNGTEDDPAVVIERSGLWPTETAHIVSDWHGCGRRFPTCSLTRQNNVVKRAHELNETE